MNEILEAMHGINPVQCSKCRRIIYIVGQYRSFYVCIDCLKGID